ncbi:hypothetical protein PMAYCL1PPCAC_03206, partial [Pristionchus mayeri]
VIEDDHAVDGLHHHLVFLLLFLHFPLRNLLLLFLFLLLLFSLLLHLVLLLLPFLHRLLRVLSNPRASFALVSFILLLLSHFIGHRVHSSSV